MVRDELAKRNQSACTVHQATSAYWNSYTTTISMLHVVKAVKAVKASMTCIAHL